MANQDFRIIFPDVVPESLRTEYVDFELWVKSRLGDDFVGVELSPKQIWWALQEADMKFAARLNTAWVTYNMSQFYGLSTDQDVSNIQPNYTFSYLKHVTKGYDDKAGIGGSNKDFLGFFDTVEGQQNYDLRSVLKDRSGSAVDFSNGIEIFEVMYTTVTVPYAYIDTWSYYNIMAGEFGVNSVMYNTMWAALPVNSAVMMMQHVQYNNKLRLGNFSWEMYGADTLRLYPVPGFRKRIYVRYKFPQPIDRNISITGSASGETATGNNSYVGKYTSAKLDVMEWANLNSIAKSWIRFYALAICKEILSFNRGKFKEVPFSNENNMVQLNWEYLAEQSKSEKDALLVELEKDLERVLNKAELFRRDADAAQAINDQLKFEPMFIYWTN